MFTGIIECIATVARIEHEGSNTHFTLQSPISAELKPDQSVAHNGVCLTVVQVAGNTHTVTAVAETLAKTNLNTWQPGYEINLERSLRIGDRLDGHFVQGRVDGIATCIGSTALDGSWLYRFRYPQEFAPLVIEKGSVCLNGVSLTAFDAAGNEFSVAIIPYTYAHTNFHTIEEGCLLNVEFDVLGKYIVRNMGQAAVQL